VNPEVLVNIGVPAAEARHIKLRQGKGCPKCANTGYKGRIALYEVMPMTEEVREFILNGASAAEIKREAMRGGMLSLRQSGLTRLKEGVTTIEEVLRVTAAD
jgi:type IV pilus assembly protein PilB